ncbi:PGF-CTERM sorting domain-containing protein [Halobaculum sp. D14]|uniref:PGF-CTERM sorting domain-containing protein n=1 Tax=Halobaculum sp. D14 TaxID=3421642 RepID=UPI003EBDA5D9
MERETGTLRTLTAVAFAALLVVPTGAVAFAPGEPVVGGSSATQLNTERAAQTTASTSEDVAFVRTIEEMKGHLAVSRQYAKAGNTKLAILHAGHPHREYWTAVNATLREANATLASELEAALLAAPNHARNDSASEYATYLNETVFDMLDRAERAVVGDRVENATFNAKVSRDLLQRAVQEYGEGVAANGTVVNRMEYDDARGFVIRAESLYANHVRATLSEHARAELDEMFETLHSAIGDSKAPSDVKSITNGIAAEYSEYTGIDAETNGSGVEKVVAEITEHLHEAVEAYANGNEAKAKQIIRQTYLSYFEGLEGELIEKRPELVEELEADFNEDLPGLIERNASVSKVRSEVESMEKKLAEVETVLSTESEKTISLGNETETATTTQSAATTESETTTTTSTPGFGVGVTLCALAGAFLALRRRSN